MRNSMSNDEKQFMEKTMNRVFDLIKQSGKKEYPLELEIGLSRSAIQNWRLNKSKAGTYSLAKIANYFNVTLDYLVGRESLATKQDTNQSNNATISPVFDRFSKLTELQQAKVMAYIDGMQEVKPSNSINTKQLIADAVNGKTTKEKSNKNKKMA